MNSLGLTFVGGCEIAGPVDRVRRSNPLRTSVEVVTGGRIGRSAARPAARRRRGRWRDRGGCAAPLPGIGGVTPKGSPCFVHSAAVDAAGREPTA